MTREANLALIQSVHAGDRPWREKLREVVSDDLEWWTTGPPDVLPWTGTFRGRDGLRRQSEIVREHLSYDRFDVEEYLADSESVVAIIEGTARVRATNRTFASRIVRIFTLRDGLVRRVRTWYDTAAYARAIGRRA